MQRTALRFHAVAALISLILFVKFATYAWLVTPLWDIPDEPGHYAYAESISRGEWPILGEARFSSEVMRSWKGPEARPARNWIAQHPPLFYVADAPTIMIARMAGLDFEETVRAARLPSALFGALTILGLAMFLARATGSSTLGLAGAIVFAATPMFTHLSTGVTHDTLVACTAAWGAYWWVRWLQSDDLKHLLYACVLVALCTITKITALAMAVPLFFTIALRLWRSDGGGHRLVRWLVQTSAVWLVMFGPALMWMARNLSIFGQPMPDALMLSNQPRVAIGYFELMREHPFWEHTLLNFIALVGWNGSEGGKLAWIQANGWVARYFLAVLGGAAIFTVLAPLLTRLDALPRRMLIGAGMIILAARPLPVLWTSIILALALLATFLTQLPSLLRDETRGWLLATAAVCVLAFAWIYYHHLWNSYIGAMRATHGRYFYPVAPFLLLVLTASFHQRVASRIVLCSALGALIVSDAFYLHQVFPLFGHLPS